MSPLRLAAGVAVVTAGLFVPAALSDPPKPVPAAPVAPADGDGLRSKVVRLERVELVTYQRKVSELLGPLNTAPDPAVAPGGFGGRGLGGGPPGQFGGGICGGNCGGFGGINGFAGFAGTPAPTTPVGRPLWRAIAIQDARILVVRGTDRHLAAAGELLAVLDRPPGAPLPPLEVVRALALARVSAPKARETLVALDYTEFGATAVDDKLLLVFGPKPTAEAAAALVADLDAPPAGPKP